MSLNTSKVEMGTVELGEELDRIYKSGSDYNYTAAKIISYLRDNNLEAAITEFQRDYDKIPGYRVWGRQFKDLGCNYLIPDSTPTEEQELASMIISASTEQKILMRDRLLTLGDEISVELAEQINKLIQLNKMVN